MLEPLQGIGGGSPPNAVGRPAEIAFVRQSLLDLLVTLRRRLQLSVIAWPRGCFLGRRFSVLDFAVVDFAAACFEVVCFAGCLDAALGGSAAKASRAAAKQIE